MADQETLLDEAAKIAAAIQASGVGSTIPQVAIALDILTHINALDGVLRQIATVIPAIAPIVGTLPAPPSVASITAKMTEFHHRKSDG